MSEAKFTWGPFARGLYASLMWMTLLVAFFDTSFLYYYIPALVFLGLGLRPLLEKTGMADIALARSQVRHEKRWQKIKQQRAQQLRRDQHAQKQKRKRSKDSELPKNW